ncbi:MAG: type II toxin-antitoxin system RelE family toxin [Actinomycetota bacterium]
MARVVFSRAARLQVNELDIRVAEAVLDATTALESDPQSGKQLRGRFEGLWSYRVGAYRVVYQVRDSGKTVRVLAVLHRRVAYLSDPR